MTQKEALERLAKWGMGETWAYEWYLDLLARNVAAMATEKREYMEGMGYTVNESPLLRAAVNVTHATIQSLEVDDAE